MIPFVKTQALGNDFILVEQNPKVPANHSELAQRICNRYFGIGADGLILWQSAADSFNIRIFNRDGSEAECSGNGLRCMAAYLMESGHWSHATSSVVCMAISDVSVRCTGHLSAISRSLARWAASRSPSKRILRSM